MPRKKKSRKVGQIGTPKITSNARKPTEPRFKKHKGKPAGTRNSEATTTNSSNYTKVSNDPRHGSKKPIDLFAETSKDKKKSAPKIKHFSPAKELEAIEQDTHFSTLLEKVELGKKLSKEEQNFVDKSLARHKVLCGLLGLNDTPEESNNANEEDLYSGFESINIDDYKE